MSQAAVAANNICFTFRAVLPALDWIEARAPRSYMDFSPLIAFLSDLGDAYGGIPSEVSIDIPATVRRAQAGDSDAVATLYQVFVQPIHRYLSFRAPSDADAEDLTAEVFLKMVEGLPGYKLTEVPFEAWLYRIASARMADFYRRSIRRPSAELDEQLPDEEDLPEERILQKEMLETVRAALRQLSEEHQTILILRFVERKSHQEVADILGRSMTAVKSAQYRALTQLANLLGADQKTRHYLRGKDG
jgi:RNA polymerase sigma-70 factor (ECF subfamily)